MKSKAKKGITSGLGLQIIFWGVYVVSEYLANAMHIPMGESWTFLRSTILFLPALLLATYIIIQWGIPYFLQTQRWIAFSILVLCIAVFLFYARIKWLVLIQYLDHHQVFQIPGTKVLKNVIRDYATITLAICIHIINDYRVNQKLNERLIKAKAEAEIKLLKGQLQPHFLFNSLNNIYSLALLQSKHTADSILMLTDLLDYLVYRANMDAVLLDKELQLLENYIGLEKLRYAEQLQLQMDVSGTTEGIMIAPLILLPFAENCFKHGGPGPDGYFKIHLALEASPVALTFLLRNTKKEKIEAPQLPGGVGLQNLKERLRLIYPNRHQLEISETRHSYQVWLKIKLETYGKV